MVEDICKNKYFITKKKIKKIPDDKRRGFFY